MTTKIIDNNGVVSLGSISSETDLTMKARIHINPPPEDGRCDCCGRYSQILDRNSFTSDPRKGWKPDIEGFKD